MSIKTKLDAQVISCTFLSMINVEAITFDSGETVIITHNSVENVLARLVNTFLNRDVSLEE